MKPVTDAVPWISSFVIVESSKNALNKKEVTDNHLNSKMHLCLDLSNLNKVTNRESYYYRTMEDVIPELHADKYFTIIDMKVDIGRYH